MIEGRSAAPSQEDAGTFLDNATVGWLACATGLVCFAAGTTEDSTAGQPTVLALDARTGDRVWAVIAGVGPQVPALADGVLYTSDVSAATAPYDRMRGEVYALRRWQRDPRINLGAPFPVPASPRRQWPVRYPAAGR
jgi:outer membrane protein assembly factor BamB